MNTSSNRKPISTLYWRITRSKHFPFYAILLPIGISYGLNILMSTIYRVFHPPAIFDELTSTSTAIESVAYYTNTLLWYLLAFVSFILIPVGLVLAVASIIVRIVTRIRRT